jgi:hypothetical protein
LAIGFDAGNERRPVTEPSEPLPQVTGVERAFTV